MMSDGFWIAVLIVAGVIVYTIGKVRRLAKESERQWDEADKSKIKTWDDDEDA